MALPRGLRPLGYRDFRLFWLGQLVSRVGAWMQSVGQAWLVLELTNSPFRLGIISTLQFAPVLLFSLLGGVLSDRVPKRRVILFAKIAMMGQAFALAGLVWSGHIAYWHVAVLAAVYGVANSLDMPARQSYVVELVGKDDLMAAIVLNSAIFNSARVIGPALAGALIGVFGVGPMFLINGVSFIAVIGALLAMRTEGAPHPGARASVREELLQSLRYVVETPTIMLVLALLLFVSLFVINFNVVVPLVARDVLGEGAHGYGLLMAALGGGAVLGALGVASAGLRRPTRTMVIAAATMTSAGVLALGLVSSFALAAAILVVTGLGQIIFTSSVNSMMQVMVPDRMRGRMMSFYVLVFVGATPAGAFLMGLLAEHFGVSLACALGGAAGIISVAVVAVRWHAHAPMRVG